AYWCVGLTSGYLMGMRLGLGGVGLWLGLALGLAIASIILTWRFHRLISAQLRLQPSETTL
ncbi:MAG TPA: MATE family efflux transporter, partial [Chroococcidiopsis sp.]